MSERSKRESDRPIRPVRALRDRVLEAAIDDDQIALVFQPQIDPRSGQVVAVEALARWDGCDGAEALFARAAAARLSERLSRCVQRKALRAAAAWNGPLCGLGLSLNVLPQDVARPGYEHWLLGEVSDAKLDPSRLTLEIVESALMADHDEIAERLAKLRAVGVRIAVDDFGTGYSSLAYLTALPLDVLKIDRGLIADIVGGARDRIVVKAMLTMARELGLKTVVEGVESAAQLALLAAWGCDLYQGFLGAGALAGDELARFTAASNAQPIAA
jgi:EAL domain-containing protein (putative c-di-GMP-specific phosphodiesterase class I)